MSRLVKRKSVDADALALDTDAFGFFRCIHKLYSDVAFASCSGILLVPGRN